MKNIAVCPECESIYIKYFGTGTQRAEEELKKLFPGMPFGQARLYVAGRNLITITDYSGMDPEVGYGDERSFVSGIDLGFYPAPKIYLMGINLKF